MEEKFPCSAADCASLVLPEMLPVMLLSECWLFPGCLLPLFIFEERYREMVRQALRSHRMFCIGTRMPSDPDRVLPISTAGIVNACVKHADGTSHLVLQGTRRIRLRNWVNDDTPYRVARIEPVETEPFCHAAVSHLREEVMNKLPPCHGEAGGLIGHLCARLRVMTNCEFVCDVLTYHFVRDPEVLNASLVETNLERRYRLLLEAL